MVLNKLDSGNNTIELIFQSLVNISPKLIERSISGRGNFLSLLLVAIYLLTSSICLNPQSCISTRSTSLSL